MNESLGCILQGIRWIIDEVHAAGYRVDQTDYRVYTPLDKFIRASKKTGLNEWESYD